MLIVTLCVVSCLFMRMLRRVSECLCAEAHAPPFYGISESNHMSGSLLTVIRLRKAAVLIRPHSCRLFSHDFGLLAHS